MKRVIHFTTVLFLILAGVVAAGESGDGRPPVTVEASVDKNEISIGDRLKYTIRIKTEKDIEVRLPSFAENLGEFAVKDFGSSEGGFWGRRKIEQWYILDIYETGIYTIPAANIGFRERGKEEWHDISTEEITVEVKSLLDESAESAEIKDIAGPRSVYDMRFMYIILAIAALIALIALIIIILKKRKKSKEAAVPAPPAHLIALESLRELMKKDYLKSGKIQEYYFELSDIVRHYLENRFYLKAPEMTTEEFLNYLRSTDKLRSEHKSLLREFLAHCDMVKFARYHPEEKEIESSYESARRLVEQTKEINAL